VSVTVEQFKAEYPEFENAEDTVVQAKLDMASRQINATCYGGKTDDGVKLRTAKILARSPLGEQARLRADSGATIYDADDAALQRQVASGGRVI